MISNIKGNNMICKCELLKQICLVVDMKWNLQKYIILSKKCSGTFNLNFTFSLSIAISVKGEVMEVGVIVVSVKGAYFKF